MQPKFFVSCPPDKPGHVFAVLYVESSDDIHGWHIEAKNRYFSAAFLSIENFYTKRGTHLYRSVQDDVYGPWTIDYPPAGDRIRCPVPDTVCHELERLQSNFVNDWLFFKEDPHSAAEQQAYSALGLPVEDVNIKSRRMHRLDRNRTCMSAGADLNVVDMLRKYWRLGDKMPPRC